MSMIITIMAITNEHRYGMYQIKKIPQGKKILLNQESPDFSRGECQLYQVFFLILFKILYHS